MVELGTYCQISSVTVQALLQNSSSLISSPKSIIRIHGTGFRARSTNGFRVCKGNAVRSRLLVSFSTSFSDVSFPKNVHISSTF